MSRVRIAAGTRIVAEAGAAIADAGGNSVDAVIAATIVSMCTDTGIMAPGAGGFVSVWPRDDEPVVIDGYVEIPGRGLLSRRFGEASWEVVFDYGGEMRSRVGYGAVATPGAFAGLAHASRRYGRLDWKCLVQPAVEWVERGFPLTGGAAEYLRYTHKAIYSWHHDSYHVLHRADGGPLRAGDIVRIPHLAESLRSIAETEATSLYGGELGQRIATGVRAEGGLLGIDDLLAYQPVARTPLRARIGEWDVATNPPPAVGGPCLAAMLLLLDRPASGGDGARAVRDVVMAQHAVLDYRRRQLDGAHERLDDEVEVLLGLAAHGDPHALLAAPSTTHISAVDEDGLACAVTASAGYGSGAMVEGTGFWLNNSLGELDLHPNGLEGLAPGSRLASNMAPAVARRADGAILAIGSPGASRITTAIAQVLYNYAARGMPLEQAVSYPRLHLEFSDRVRSIAFEPGLPVEPMAGLTPRPFDQRSMYFGGVQVALWSPAHGLAAVADTRRGGSVAEGGRR